MLKLARAPPGIAQCDEIPLRPPPLAYGLQYVQRAGKPPFTVDLQQILPAPVEAVQHEAALRIDRAAAQHRHLFQPMTLQLEIGEQIAQAQPFDHMADIYAQRAVLAVRAEGNGGMLKARIADAGHRKQHVPGIEAGCRGIGLRHSDKLVRREGRDKSRPARPPRNRSGRTKKSLLPLDRQGAKTDLRRTELHLMRSKSMAISKGEKLPSTTFTKMTENGPEAVESDAFFAGRKVALFSVPGAFTPTCSAKHLPGYIEKADELKAKGVEEIACTAVNDAFVMGAWGKAAGADGKVTLLADGNGAFAKAVGLEMDGSKFGMGTRGQRFSIIVNDGVVEEVNVEAPGEFKVSSAEHMLGQL